MPGWRRSAGACRRHSAGRVSMVWYVVEHRRTSTGAPLDHLWRSTLSPRPDRGYVRLRRSLGTVPLLDWSTRYGSGCRADLLTTDQKVRGSNPFGRATSSGLSPAYTLIARRSGFVHCGPQVLLGCSSVSELFVTGFVATSRSTQFRPDLDGGRKRVRAVDRHGERV